MRVRSVGSSLLLKGLAAMQQDSGGITPGSVLTWETGLPDRYQTEEGGSARFYTALTERLKSVPGVAGATGIGESEIVLVVDVGSVIERFGGRARQARAAVNV